MPNMPLEVERLQLNLLGTHDTPRALTALGGEPENGRTVRQLAGVKMNEEEYAVARDRLILSYLIAATFPGRPMIYYGDEAGMEGYADPMNRMPYPWGREDKVILDAFRKIGKLRSEFAPFRDGSFRVVHLDENLFVYKRKAGKSAFRVFINRSQYTIKVSFDNKKQTIKWGRTQNGSILLSPRSGAVLAE